MIPQNKLAGDMFVIGENKIESVNLVESAPPKVSLPFVTDAEYVGSKETPSSLDRIVPWRGEDEHSM